MAENSAGGEIRLELLKIENEMDRVGGWNLHTRWKSGRLLIDLRNPDTGYLPKGQLTTLAATLKVSTRELSDRMRVADTYRTDTAFKRAAQGCGTWSALIRSLPPTRDARTGSTKPPKPWRKILYEALGHALADKLLTKDERPAASKLYELIENSDA